MNKKSKVLVVFFIVSIPVVLLLFSYLRHPMAIEIIGTALDEHYVGRYEEKHEPQFNVFGLETRVVEKNKITENYKASSVYRVALISKASKVLQVRTPELLYYTQSISQCVVGKCLASPVLGQFIIAMDYVPDAEKVVLYKGEKIVAETHVARE